MENSFKLHLNVINDVPFISLEMHETIFDFTLNLGGFHASQRATWLNHPQNNIRMVLVDGATMRIIYVRNLQINEEFIKVLKNAMEANIPKTAEEVALIAEALEQANSKEDIVKNSKLMMQFYTDF